MTSNRSGIKGLDKLLKFNIHDVIDDEIINALNKIGEFALSKTNLHEFDNYSFNLEDSYAYAVYKNGNIVSGPVLLDKKATDPNPIGGKFGRDYSKDYLKEIKPQGGYSLVVVANTPYAVAVEMSNRDVMVSLTWETINEAKDVFSNLRWTKL